MEKSRYPKKQPHKKIYNSEKGTRSSSSVTALCGPTFSDVVKCFEILKLHVDQLGQNLNKSSEFHHKNSEIC